MTWINGILVQHHCKILSLCDISIAFPKCMHTSQKLLLLLLGREQISYFFACVPNNFNFLKCSSSALLHKLYIYLIKGKHILRLHGLKSV